MQFIPTKEVSDQIHVLEHDGYELTVIPPTNSALEFMNLITKVTEPNAGPYTDTNWDSFNDFLWQHVRRPSEKKIALVLRDVTLFQEKHELCPPFLTVPEFKLAMEVLEDAERYAFKDNIDLKVIVGID